MAKKNLYKIIGLILTFAFFQYGHMNNDFYYLSVYTLVSYLLLAVSIEYYGKKLLFEISLLGFVCSLNPLIKELFRCGDKLLWSDYIFGYGALMVLVLLIIKYIRKDG